MGCTWSTSHLPGCDGVSAACGKQVGGSCGCTTNETEELVVGSFDRPSFVKWLADQIHFALDMESSRKMNSNVINNKSS